MERLDQDDETPDLVPAARSLSESINLELDRQKANRPGRLQYVAIDALKLYMLRSIGQTQVIYYTVSLLTLPPKTVDGSTLNVQYLVLSIGC